MKMVRQRLGNLFSNARRSRKVLEVFVALDFWEGMPDALFLRLEIACNFDKLNVIHPVC